MNRSTFIAVAVIALGLIVACTEAALAASGAKVVLHETATVMANDNGFFTLGSISDISGGTPELRDRLNNVEVGRAPLDTYARHLNLGDVALKLRQAGLDPYRDVKLSGAENITVVTAALVRAPKASASPASTTTGAAPPIQAPAIVIHRGDPVTILVQDGVLTVTAVGESRDTGAVGDMIHVHRPGIMTDIEVQVLDSHTVQMEI